MRPRDQYINLYESKCSQWVLYAPFQPLGAKVLSTSQSLLVASAQCRAEVQTLRPMFFVVRGNIAIPVVPRCKFPVDAHTQPRYKDTAGLSQMLPGAREFVVEGSVWDGDGIKKSRIARR